MSTIRDQAIVLRHWEWSESSQTAALFTRAHGLIRGLAKGARREKGRFSGGLELLTRGEVVAILKQTTDLATLTDWDLQEVFPRLRNDLRTHHAGLYLADVLAHALRPLDPHPRLWDEAHATLRSLDEGGSPSEALVRFQWATLVETGHQPRLDWPDGAAKDAAVVGFDPVAGGLCADPGEAPGVSGPWRIRGETVRALRGLEAQEPNWTRAAPATLDRMNRFLAACLTWILGRDLPTRACVFRDVPETEEPGLSSRSDGSG